MFLSGVRATVATNTDVFTITDAAPAAQGTVQFVAPGVNVLGVVNQQYQENWFTTVPAEKDLEITDAADIVLYFQANAQGLTVFEVRLLDVHPNGQVELLAKDSQQFVTAFDPSPVTFFMDAQGKVVRHGHFVEVQVYAQTGNVAVLMQYGASTPSGVQKFFARWLDSDGDGVADTDELLEGSNPLDPSNFQQKWRDSDDDGITDIVERTLGTDPTRRDSDGDGFGDGVEFHAGSDPVDANSRPRDANGNGLPDVYENHYTNNTTVNNGNGLDPFADPDHDGCNNLCEASHGTDAADPDTDHDGVADGTEIAAQTNPLGNERATVDADGDGLSDVFESTLGTKANVADTDGDGFGDGVEVFAGTNPLDARSFPRDDDKDGLPDSFEINYFNTTTVGPREDPDRDGCDNLCEAAHATDPTNPDTDGDGTNDGDEIQGRTDPLSPGPPPVAQSNRLQLQVGAGFFAMTSILSLFGIMRWKP